MKIGTDPEFFLVREDKVIPGYFALGGDVDIELPFGKIYPDGAAVEMQVVPSDNVEDLVRMIGDNISVMKSHLHGEIYVTPHAPIDASFINALDESYGKRASLQILGCSPDACIYDTDIPARPDPKTYHYRTTGGHIHFGVGDEVEKLSLMHACVGMLDRMLGTATTYLSDTEEARRRKVLYGQAGMYRLSSFKTLEYRVPTCQALLHSAELAYHMFSLGQKVVSFCLEHSVPEIVTALGGTKTIRATSTAINNHDLRTCRELQNLDIGREHVEFLQQYQLPKTFELAW